MKSGPNALASLLQKSGSEVAIPISGHSMEPSFSDGTLVRVRCGALPTLGQIIVFGDRDRLVAHRVEALIRTRHIPYLITRGDNQWAYDRPIPQDCVMGVVTDIKSAEAWIDPPVFRAKHGFVKTFVSATALTFVKTLLRISAPLALWHADVLIFCHYISLRITRYLSPRR